MGLRLRINFKRIAAGQNDEFHTKIGGVHAHLPNRQFHPRDHNCKLLVIDHLIPVVNILH